jgi:hypothetical protein
MGTMRLRWAVCGLVVVACAGGCRQRPADGADAEVVRRGSVEVTAELVEIPDKFPDIPMYDYAFVLKYRVLEVHRGEVAADVIYVGHYNPLKARAEAADARVREIGGDVKRSRAGDIHRMALEVPIDDYYMGGIINKYHGTAQGPIYWAVWTNRVVR